MITLIKALIIGFVIGFIPVIPWIGMHWSLGILLGIAISFFFYFKFMQKINADVRPIFENAQKMMQQQKWKQAMDILETARPFSNKMFLLDGQIEAQLGMIYYFQSKEDDAIRHFEKSTTQNWFSMAIYAFLLSKKKQDDEMVKKFEAALRFNKKEVLLWNAYAFCLNRINKTDDAINVLNRALKKIGKNPETEANLKSLQNNKGMNMKPFGEMWYSLKMEPIPKQFMQRTSNHPGDRGFKQKRG